MSIEFGIDAAMRRASASTNGRPATMRRFWLAATGWARMSEISLCAQGSEVALLSVAHHRNGGTNGRACVPLARLTRGWIIACKLLVNDDVVAMVRIGRSSGAVGR